jgi:transposase
VTGATSVVKLAKGPKGRGSQWLIALLKRKTPKQAAVALANKMARIAWKLMTTGENYDNARLNAAASQVA